MMFEKDFNECCFCGEMYEGYGNSTWGCWSESDEENGVGEQCRCCDKCNENIVIPRRLAALKKRDKLINF